MRAVENPTNSAFSGPEPINASVPGNESLLTNGTVALRIEVNRFVPAVFEPARQAR
jgi:hypothetical protein